MEQDYSRTLALQSWIVRHYEDWRTICGRGTYPISAEEFMRLHRMLMDLDFQEITLVLLECHYYAIQDRAALGLRHMAKTQPEALRNAGLDPEEILKALEP